MEKKNSKLLKACATMGVLEKELQKDPQLMKIMKDNEEYTQKWILDNSSDLTRTIDGIITIPVVVNVLYRMPYENISQKQILSQIDVLNEDFNGGNKEWSLIPPPFNTIKADVGIRFYLDGVVRRMTSRRSWPVNDSVKIATMGGINPTSPTTKLNIWVCTIENNILGYAKFPGGNPLTDGLVILNSAFGSREKHPRGYYQPRYDKGRTTTHELGHWLNLYHPWGPTALGADDLVEDTPPQTGPSYECFTMPTDINDASVEPILNLNHMDYLEDSCMWMFTNGQKARMLATFSPRGPRSSFLLRKTNL